MDFIESLWAGGGGQVDRQRLEETIYVALSYLLYLSDVEEQRGRGLKLLYGKQGKSHKPEELLWGVKRKLPRELTTELELPAYFNLLWCKKIYALVYT